MKLLSIPVLFIMSLSSVFATGLHINGTRLLEPDGSALVLRGVNHPYAWYTGEPDVGASFREIAARGANSVRVVLSNGDRWRKTTADEVARVLDGCRVNRLIVVLEVHDATGFGDDPEAVPLKGMVDYWLELADLLKGKEDRVIINIANEPYGVEADRDNLWIAEHVDAIRTLRAAGLRHVLMVDAPDWGQDHDRYGLNHFDQILEVDSQVMFSVHMYQVYKKAADVRSYLQAAHEKGYCTVVGEFAHVHQGEEVDEAAIMRYSREFGFGYLGWSWIGNSEENKELDMARQWAGGELTEWGKILFERPDGIRATSRTASLFSGCRNPSAETK
jgi:mannan endo-1,4-beta-mannosidase